MQYAPYQNCKICNAAIVDFLPQFELVKCINCGFIFYKQPLQTAYVKALYDQLYNQQDDYSLYKQQASLLQQGKQPHLGYNKIKILRTLLNRHCKKIAEIGAGVGIVGRYLQRKKIRYQGIELDEQAAQLAQSAGVNMINDTFRALGKFESLDAILAFEVLEHIDDIKECFELIHQRIRPGGYIGFSVPNFKNFYNQSSLQQQTSLGQVGPPVHINFFTVENLQPILTQFQFSPVYLHPRRYPTLLWNKKATYKKLWRSLRGKYEGSTLLCVAKKIG